MANGTVGVQQAGSPDRLIDNEVLTVGGQTVYRQRVTDKFTGGEVLADLTGAGAVLTFTFASAVQLVWVFSAGADSRADPFGGTPSATLGIPCDTDTPMPLTVETSSVKVYAPTGATVTVWGFRY